MVSGRERLMPAHSGAGFARASDSGGGFGGGRRGPLRRSGMGEHIVVVYGKEPA
jgi:hypothetical protein